MKKKSGRLGSRTSKPEVSAVTKHGIWLLVDKVEYFAPFADYPWFQTAPAKAIFYVETPHKGHLRWPDLDVDLHVESLTQPHAYPLLAKAAPLRPKRKRSA
ncbi:MAG: DUF2442 domain-containing protein [Deltaproteobacteria bacterium]|nr:DUF2442 domain-containing protein [Deltaproteobacteria bacterium]